MLSTISSLQTENASLMDRVAELGQRLERQERRDDDAAQYSRRNCIRVSGLKEVEGENLYDVITDHAREIQADIDLSDVDNMHRHLPNHKQRRHVQGTLLSNSQVTARGKTS